MKHRALPFLCISACLFLLAGCKDDDDKKSYNFQGHMEITGSIPSYVNPGESIEISASGLRASFADPDVPDIFYSFLVSPHQTKRDTSETFRYEFPDVLGTTTLSIYGSAKGYTSASLEYLIEVVNSTESLKGQEFDPDGGIFTDSRDSRKYHYTSIAGTDWMSQNLAYCGFGKAFKGIKDSGCEAMTDIYGMYYTWDEATKACPQGWRLPTEEEWTAMCQTVSDKELTAFETYKGIAGKLMCNAQLNGKRLWEYFTIFKIDPTASYFNALPAGFANKSDSIYLFDDTGSYASFWTADEYNAEQAWCRYIVNNSENADILAQPLNKSGVAMPVRCVRSSE